jgi:hypothetical protein
MSRILNLPENWKNYGLHLVGDDESKIWDGREEDQIFNCML